MRLVILTERQYMNIAKSLAVIANELKELGADHGVITNLQQEIAGLDQEVQDDIKAALAGFVAPPDPATAAEIADLQKRVAALEQGVEDLGGDADDVVVTNAAITGTAGQSVSGQLAATGGTGPYTFAVTGAPADITFNTDGSYSGSPAAAETATIVVTATDSAGSVSAPSSMTVNIAAAAPPPSLSVSPGTLGLAVGAAVTGQLSVSGGTAPYSFVSSLADVTVDSSGNLGGTPAAAETGTITVTDSSTPPLTADVPVSVA